jgi:hypothetical protein
MHHVVLNKYKYFVSELGSMLPITRGYLSEPQTIVGCNAVKYQTLLGDW